VSGVHIPDAIIDRLKGAQDQAQEGVNICIEILQQLKEIDGVRGAHIMAYRQEHRVPEIVEKSGVLDGRTPWHPRVAHEASQTGTN
jgi:methylenetetrahydrofolate reductase (NADPH)